MNAIRSIIGRIAPLLSFGSSRKYWEMRYRLGGHSGTGSRGANARYKADVINRFIQTHDIGSLIEFGCGDGHQLGMIEVPRYLGIDVSPTILAKCRAMYADDSNKRFLLDNEYTGETATLAVSLDVIFHLVEDAVYDSYLSRLFAAGERYVMVYSTSTDMPDTGTPHVRHRDVARDIADRFPGFSRMVPDEAALPAPVSFDRGLPVTFLLYVREL
jgi:hypothetical protein